MHVPFLDVVFARDRPQIRDLGISASVMVIRSM
jgi:hypothetical protein